MTIVFRSAPIDKEKLREIILKNSEFIQQGLGFIDSQLGGEEDGLIDFLGTDVDGRLAIVNFDVKENSDLLICALSQVHWINKNQKLLKRLFFSENINFGQPPQIILVAPCFSDKLKSAAKQLLDHEIRLYSFKYLFADNQDAIIFEEIFYNKAGMQSNLTGMNAADSRVFSLKTLSALSSQSMFDDPATMEGVPLTAEEIAEFMNFEKEPKNKDSSE